MSDLAEKYAIKFENVRYGYEGGRVIDGLTGGVERGEILLVVGPNSSGKTTLAKLCVGLIAPTEGTISIPKNNVGYVPQGSGLIANRTAFENLVLPLRYIHDYAGEATFKERIDAMIGRFGLEPYKGKLPSLLSAGVQKKIAIARALLLFPSVVVVDNLTQEIDILEGIRTLELLKGVSIELNLTVILFSAHIEPEARIADRIAVLGDGRFRCVGRPREILRGGDPWIDEILKAERAMGKGEEKIIRG